MSCDPCTWHHRDQLKISWQLAHMQASSTYGFLWTTLSWSGKKTMQPNPLYVHMIWLRIICKNKFIVLFDLTWSFFPGIKWDGTWTRWDGQLGQETCFSQRVWRCRDLWHFTALRTETTYPCSNRPGPVVQNTIMLVQDRCEFWFQFSNF